MSIHKTPVDVAGSEIQVNIDYDFIPACKGATDGPFGPKIEPDEPSHIEINGAFADDGKIVDLSRRDAKRIKEEIAEYLFERALSNREQD